jgi:membrane peptidoglycan carboxypeptidase
VGLRNFFRTGGMLAWGLIGAVLLLMVASTALFARTALIRHERDVSRMVFNDNVQLLDDVRKSTGALDDSLANFSTSSSDAIPTNKPYIVVSIEDHRLWYKQGDSVLFTTQVATGSGKVLEGAGGDARWKFETPRGRLVIESK